jgi:hypothetical protein
MHELITDLEAHLKKLGRWRPLYLPRANETPLSLIPAIFEEGVGKAIEDAFRDDFENFPGRWSFDDLPFDRAEWTDDAIRAVEIHTIANERINDLARELRRARQAAKLSSVPDEGIRTP